MASSESEQKARTQNEDPESSKLAAKRALFGHDSHIVSVLRGARNGFYYGARTRAMHSFVMAVLFKKGPLMERARWILNNSWEHGRNLGCYVFLYKAMLIVLIYIFKKRHAVLSFIAAIFGSYFWFTEKTAVN